MEAKDTIIPTKEHSESVWCPRCGNEFGIECLVESRREAQAEISFKAGQKEKEEESEARLELIRRLTEKCETIKQEGIREVVGFLDKPCPHTGGLEEQQLRAMDCRKCWQAQLKLWGIEDD